MKNTLFSLLLCAVSLCLTAQETDNKEIVKKGWNFGPLPVVGWDSDLGFQYGVCLDIFNFGDGRKVLDSRSFLFGKDCRNVLCLAADNGAEHIG